MAAQASTTGVLLMPYISSDLRANLDPSTGPYRVPPAQNAGSLNFQITRLVNRYIAEHGLTYSTVNQAIGVLECAKLELYRRVAAPYEDEKIEEHGDVYDSWFES
jgi:hypothetical protein